MTILLVILYVLVCLFLILVVLLQQGKGADLAGAFGGGGSQASFGPRSGTNVMHRMTTASFVLFVVLWYMLNKTAWGRHVYAIGDDIESAELAGIRTDRTLVSVYVLAGLVCAIAGWASIGRVGSISPQSFYEGNLQSITAVRAEAGEVDVSELDQVNQKRHHLFFCPNRHLCHQR